MQLLMLALWEQRITVGVHICHVRHQRFPLGKDEVLVLRTRPRRPVEVVDHRLGPGAQLLQVPRLPSHHQLLLDG